MKVIKWIIDAIKDFFGVFDKVEIINKDDNVVNQNIFIPTGEGIPVVTEIVNVKRAPKKKAVVKKKTVVKKKAPKKKKAVVKKKKTAKKRAPKKVVNIDTDIKKDKKER